MIGNYYKVTNRFKEKFKMSDLEYLTSINSRDSKYGCLYPWQREEKPKDKPLEEPARVYIWEFPEEEYIRREPEQEPCDPYEPKRGVFILEL